jgi:hypothetical protein
LELPSDHLNTVLDVDGSNVKSEGIAGESSDVFQAFHRCTQLVAARHRRMTSTSPLEKNKDMPLTHH